MIGNPCVVSNDGRILRAACLVAAFGAVAWFRDRGTQTKGQDWIYSRFESPKGSASSVGSAGTAMIGVFVEPLRQMQSLEHELHGACHHASPLVATH